MPRPSNNDEEREIIVTVPPLKLKGTHGTCVTFAEKIRQHGFHIGAGRRGSGGYFWGYSNTAKDYATCLARAWWEYATKAGQYRSASNAGCEVLAVEISVEAENFLDLEEHTMKQKLVPFLNDIYRRTTASNRKDLAAKAYDLFVKRIESERSKPVNVIHATVNPPAREYFKDECSHLLSSEACMPACYIVKNKKCILVT